MHKGISVFKITHDEWHRSYMLADWHKGNPPGTTHLVEVTLVLLSDGQTRVCVWGNDDFGMERDFASAADAKATFDLVLARDDVSKGYLKSNGFVLA